MKKKPARSLPNIIWKCFRQIFNQEKWSGKLLEASDPVFSAKNVKIAMDSMDKRMKRGEGGSKWPKKQSNHSQTSKQRQPTTFEWTETVGDVPGSLWPSFGKSNILSIVECENRTFNLLQLFSKIIDGGKSSAPSPGMLGQHFSRKESGLNIHATQVPNFCPLNSRLSVSTPKISKSPIYT